MVSDIEPANTGQRVKWARETAGITQRELARLAGLTEGHIGMIEIRGGGLYSDTVSKLIGVFKGAMTYEWLTDGTGKAPGEKAIRAAVAKARAAAAPEAS